MSASSDPARAMGVGAGLAALVVGYSVAVRVTTPDDPVLRAWLGGGSMLDRLPVEPWRVLTAPLLHLDDGHLWPNAIVLGVLVAAVCLRSGPGRAILIAAISAIVGTLVSALAAPGLAVGASGAVFGLLGALVTHHARTRPKPALMLLALTIALLVVVPADRAAHLGGLVAGGVLGIGAWSVRWPVVAGLGLIWALAIGVAFANAADSARAPTDWRLMNGLSVPADFAVHAVGPPCGEIATDGLLSLCVVAEPTVDDPSAEWHRLPDGRALRIGVASPEVRRSRAPVVDGIIERNVNNPSRRPSGAPPARQP